MSKELYISDSCFNDKNSFIVFDVPVTDSDMPKIQVYYYPEIDKVTLKEVHRYISTFEVCDYFYDIISGKISIKLIRNYDDEKNEHNCKVIRLQLKTKNYMGFGFTRYFCLL